MQYTCLIVIAAGEVISEHRNVLPRTRVPIGVVVSFFRTLVAKPLAVVCLEEEKRKRRRELK